MKSTLATVAPTFDALWGFAAEAFFFSEEPVLAAACFECPCSTM